MNNFKFSVTYCSKHSSGIEVKCQGCGKTSKAKVSDCIDRIMEENLVPDEEGYIPCTCRRCSVLKLNSTKNKAESTKQFSIATNYILYGSKDGSELTDKVIKALKAFTQEGKLTRISVKDGLIGLCRPVNGSFEFEHYTIDEFIKALEGGMELPFDVYNKFGSWFYGKFDLTNQETFFTTQKYFVHYNGKVWFKDPNTKEYLDKETFISKLESGEIEAFGIEKQFNEWFIKGVSILDEVEVATGTRLWFEYKGQKWYKLDGQFIDMQTLSDRLDSGKYEIPIGFRKQFGVWFFGNTDILTGKEFNPNNQFKIKYRENVWIKDTITKEYIEIHEYLRLLDEGRLHSQNIFKMFGEWFRYNINILTDDKIVLDNKVFKEYKGRTWVRPLGEEEYVLVEEFVERLEAGTIKRPNGVHKRFNEWFVGQQNILTGEEYQMIGQTTAFYKNEYWIKSHSRDWERLEKLYEDGEQFARITRLGDKWFYETECLDPNDDSSLKRIGKGLVEYKDDVYKKFGNDWISLEDFNYRKKIITSKYDTSNNKIQLPADFIQRDNRILYLDKRSGDVLEVEELIFKLESNEINPRGFHKFFYNQWFYGNTNLLTGQTYENLGNGVLKYDNHYWCVYNKQLITFEQLIDIPFNGRLKRIGNEWIYKGQNILTGRKLQFTTSSFIEYKGKTYFRDPKTGVYILWKTFKEQNIKSLNLYNSSIDLFKEEQMQIVPTFRQQESLDWSKVKDAFERFLVEFFGNKPHLSYIKMYCSKDGDLKPLVAGLTSNKRINCCGTDVSFSTNISHGPSRRFLFEEGLEWCKTQIAIRTFSTREEAALHESHLQRTYGLLGS